MDWEERNPNYKIDKKSNNYRKAFGCKKKNKGKKKYKIGVNEVLKTDRIVKCRKRKDKDENDKKSTKKGKKEMNERNALELSSRIKINRKNANAKTEAQICDVTIGIRRKYDNLININDIEGRNKGKRAKTRKKKRKMNDYEGENKRKDKQRKKEGSDINENENETEVLKETKRSISKSEGIRRYFRTEDNH